MTAEQPQSLKDGEPRCVHDMRPAWCAVCLGHPDVDLYEPESTVRHGQQA